jgi:hypothetical protein
MSDSGTDAVTTTITSATGQLQPELLSVAGIAIPIGAVIFAVGFGWRWFKGLVA